MKYFLVVLNLLFVLGSSSAQNFIQKVRPFSSTVVSRLSAQIDTLKILAVMVEFQADKDETTFGNGKFGTIYSQDYGQGILDPLPHDKAYFESHLLFAKNYFNKVSNGKLVIQYTVLPGILTVSKTMRNYSPPSNSTDYTLLANFCKEVWQLADSANPGFNFSKFNVFTIFHAGAGRDVVLPGTLGNEHNIPSLYLSDEAFKNIYGNSFSGFTVNNNFNITNTIVMPETESREVSNGLTTSFLQLTINGLMAANIGSAIGLPDLYNTKTGESAIGRFGLMDGQSFFAFGGLFPPEPTPWTKIYMGWADPVTVSPGNYNDIKLFTRLAASVSDTVILKIPINSKEYFLVENRNRDVHKDGAKLTYVSNGITLNKTFPGDEDNFNNYNVSAINGVVTDVDEFDYAVPGNGIVIWHIDENVIDNNIATNSINSGTTRGIFVEEADGVQDIGQQFADIFGDVIVGEGTPEDFWFKSNPSQFFTNKFSKDTRPNTNSNTGANSLITVSDFSDTSIAMTFNVAFGDSIIKPIFVKKPSLNSSIDRLSSLTYLNRFELGTLSNSTLNILDSNGNVIYTQNNFSSFEPVSTALGSGSIYIGAFSSFINIIYRDYITNPFSTQVSVSSDITAPLVYFLGLNGAYRLLIGTQSGKIYTYDTSVSLAGVTDSTVAAPSAIKKIAANNDYYSAIAGNYFFDSNGKSLSFADSLQNLILTQNSSGDYLSIVETKSQISVIKNGVIIFSQLVDGNPAENNYGLALADLKQDGQNYIIYNNGLQIRAMNISGASADNFSFSDPLNIGFVGTPVALDFAGDSKSEIIAATKDGRIYAIDGGTGKVVDGFPLKVGTALSTSPVVFDNNGKASLAVVSDSNTVSSWIIGAGSGKYFWASENGDNYNSSFVKAASQVNYVSDYFPSSRAYNYPNPVYGNTTNIRYYVSQDSKINIKIFDIAGSFVDELNDFAHGGLDHETIWNVSKIQSGIYLARIEVTSASGQTESKIIKIAVVK